MIVGRIFITAGLGCLVWGAWLGFPLARAMATGAVANGRIIDVRAVPAGDGVMQVTAVFEYQPPNDPHGYQQGSHQANARLRPIDDPVLPTAEAMALRQQLLNHPRRRVFLSGDATTTEACIMADAESHGIALRQWLPLLLGGGLLLVSFGLRLRASRS